MPASKKLLIIGAGPSGLMAAYEARKLGYDFTIVEASDSVGGLCRTLEFEGCRFDIGRHEFPGGGEVEKMWHEIVGDEHTRFRRNDAMFTFGKFFPAGGYFQVGPLSQTMPHPGMILDSVSEEQKRKFLDSYESAQDSELTDCTNAEQYRNRLFGPEFAHEAFDGYSEKVFGLKTSEVLLSSSLPGPRSNLLMDSLHEQPFPISLECSDADGRKQICFVPRAESDWYPSLGAGMIVDRLLDLLQPEAHEILFGRNAEKLLRDDKRITGVQVKDRDGNAERLEADHYFCGLPLRLACGLLDPEAPAELSKVIHERMPSRDVIVAHLVIRKPDVTPHHFIEVPDRSVRSARVTNYKLWSTAMVTSQSLTGLGMELYLDSDDPLNQADDETLKEVFVADCQRMSLCEPGDVQAARFFRVKGVAPAEVVRYRRRRYQPVVDYLEAIENFDQTYRQGQASAMLAAKYAVRRLNGEEYDVAGIL